MKNTRTIIHLLFLCILIYISLSHIYFSKNDSRILIDHHDATYARHCTDYAFFLKNISTAKWNDIINKIEELHDFQQTHDVSFIAKCIGWTLFFFGENIFIFRISFLPFFLFLLITIYLIGKKIDSPLTGLIATLIILSIPGILTTARKCSPPLYAATFILFAIFLIFQYPQFHNNKAAICIGLFLAISTKIHYSSIFYISFIFCWLIYKYFRQKKTAHTTRFTTFLLYSTTITFIVK